MQDLCSDKQVRLFVLGRVRLSAFEHFPWVEIEWNLSLLQPVWRSRGVQGCCLAHCFSEACSTRESGAASWLIRVSCLAVSWLGEWLTDLPA